MSNDWQIENFLEIKNDRLHIDGVDAPELARDHGTPLFVFSEGRIRHNIARLMDVRKVIGCTLKLCYAAKAMSTMGILRVVKEAGCDIEVNSGGELWKAIKAGFGGSQINFNGNSKEVWEVELAIENEIYAIQVDSLYELTLIEETARRVGKRANVSLRLVPEIQSDTHSGLQTALLTSKFGMMPEEAFSAFRHYKDSDHLDLCGIHLHVGSQNPDPVVYTQALDMLYTSLKRIYRETGRRLRHLNIGGGFPVNYLRESIQLDVPESNRQLFAADFAPANALADAWHAIREDIGAEDGERLLDGLTLVLEPGRSIIADAGICLTTVRNIKTRPLKTVANTDRAMPFDTWLLTDAGFNILLSMETYKWYYHLVSAERPAEAATYRYKVAGPLCDGGDVYFDVEGGNRLPEHRDLPENVEVGEVLGLLNCGAYSLAQASQYNGRFLPAVLMVREGGDVELIRSRDSFEDLVRNDIF